MSALKLKKNRPVDFYLIREAEFAKKTKNEKTVGSIKDGLKHSEVQPQTKKRRLNVVFFVSFARSF